MPAKLMYGLERVRMSDISAKDALNVAIIGAGPAGLYTADILLRELAKTGEDLGIGTTARVDVFEKLPVPFGLVRYGVAPDHPAIKFIADALEKTLHNPSIRLLADVEFGKDLLLDDLLERYDAVIFATGAVEDRPLVLPGSNSRGVYGAAHFVEWYDGYPTSPRDWPFDATTAVVIGGGNVAMDVMRELLVDADHLREATDIPDNVYEGLKKNRLREVHVLVRRGVAQAKFSVQELRELQKLEDVQIIVDERDFMLDEATLAFAAQDKLTRQMVEELQGIAVASAKMKAEGGVDRLGRPARKRCYLHFNTNPLEILSAEGEDAVSGVKVERTITTPEGEMSTTGEEFVIPAEAVYHAIGYLPVRVPEIDYDEDQTVLLNDDGRILGNVSRETLEARPRLYVTGWAKRGPVGLIGSTKSDSLIVVNHMFEDWAKSPTKGRHAEDRDPQSINRLLSSRGIEPIDADGWRRVDAFERAQGAREGRARKKVVDAQQLRDLAHGRC